VVNIIGGQCIGGNFYGTPTGTGYSETCSADSSGLCVSPYQIPGTGDYDNLTLSYLSQSLTGCGNLNKPNAVYTFAGSFSASGTICLNIVANNITLDCRGYTLSGNGNPYGIYTSGMSSLTIKNCILSSFTFTGIYLYSSNNDTISNVTSNSNGQSGYYGYTGAGIYLDKSNYSTIANTTTNSNYGNGGYGCQGFGIYLGNSNFNTITNATANSNHGGTQMSNYFGSGIHLSSSNSNRITNVTTISNSMGGYAGYYGNNLLASGVYINGNNNTLSGAYADSSYSDGRSGYADGVYISGSNNTVSNFTARGTSANYYSYGVYISGSNNTVSNGTINSTTGNSASGTAYGVYLASGGNNTITNITIGSDVGLGGNSSVYLISSSGNLIYNNLMNDTILAKTDTNSNSWNISLNCGATNIVGGPCIGGNFWAQPDGNGWSQNSSACNANSSGICTWQYNISTNNIDYLPLTRLTGCTPASINITHNEDLNPPTGCVDLNPYGFFSPNSYVCYYNDGDCIGIFGSDDSCWMMSHFGNALAFTYNVPCSTANDGDFNDGGCGSGPGSQTWGLSCVGIGSAPTHTCIKDLSTGIKKDFNVASDGILTLSFSCS